MNLSRVTLEFKDTYKPVGSNDKHRLREFRDRKHRAVTIDSGVTKLDDKGRCCGRKPIVYKRDGHLFCDRCDRAFDINTGEQVANWAWRVIDGEWLGVKR